MKWYKHDTDAHADARIKRLIFDWGIEGYGLYFYCLELIAGSVRSGRMKFELEHDSEIIAKDVGMSKEKVENIMRCCIDLELFEESSNRIFCFKLLSRMDASQTSNPAFREEISRAKEGLEKASMSAARDGEKGQSCHSHDSVMLEVEDRNRNRNRNRDCSPAEAGSQESCPTKEIIDLYHATLPELRTCRKITPKRRQQIKRRWIEDLKSLDEWVIYFNYIRGSDFLMGRSEPQQGRTHFEADIEWITNNSNFAKIIEGRYHGGVAPKKYDDQGRLSGAEQTRIARQQARERQASAGDTA